MRRSLLAATLGATAAIITAAPAAADIGDIRDLSIDPQLGGTAEAVALSGQIRCTTQIDYGLIAKVVQPPDTLFDNVPTDNAPIEGVGAYGPIQGNEANTPCSTSLQGYEVVVQRNRDSGSFSDTGAHGGPQNMGALVGAGTSAESGGRGPGPIIGDFEGIARAVDFERVDP